MVLTLPTAAYYATADYRHAGFELEIVGVLTESQVKGLDEVARPKSVVPFLSLVPATLKTPRGTVTDGAIYFTSRPDRLDLTWFRDSQTLSGDPEELSGNWVDISSTVAHRLHAGPGDKLDIPIGGDVYSAVVRRVMAISRLGVPDVAVGNLTQELTTLLGSDPAGFYTVTLLGAPADRSKVDAIAASGFKGKDSMVRTRTEALSESDTSAQRRPATILAISLLGVALLCGVAIREGSHLATRGARDLATLMTLGARRRNLIAALVVVEGSATLLAVLGATWLVTHLAYGQIFAPALPLTLYPALFVGMASVVLAYTGVLCISTSRRLRSARLLQEIAR